MVRKAKRVGGCLSKKKMKPDILKKVEVKRKKKPTSKMPKTKPVGQG